MAYQVTSLTGTDRDGKPVKTSRHGFLTKTAAEILLWRLGWLDGAMRHNEHVVYNDGSNERTKEGDAQALDLSQTPSKEQRRKASKASGRYVEMDLTKKPDPPLPKPKKG